MKGLRVGRRAGACAFAASPSFIARAEQAPRQWLWLVAAALLLAAVLAAPVPATAAPTAEEQAARSQVNFRRGQVGLPPLGYNSHLEQSSRGHAAYLAIHDTTGHFQTSGLAGFTGNAAFDRISATAYGAPWASNEVISFGASTGVDAIEGLLQAIYHRFGIFSTRANEVGVGAVTNHPSFGTVFVVNSARQFAPPPGPGGSWVGVYPYDGQSGVTRDFLSDSESPDPVPAADRVGYPISIHVDDGRVLAVTSFTVAPVAGTALAALLLKNATDPNTPVSAAALIPLAPLAYGTEYEASFTGTVDGASLTKTWRFTTVPLQPITFSPAQPYLGYNGTLDIEIYGGSGVYSASISYFPPKPADLAFTGPRTVRLTSPAASVGTPVTGSVTLTVNDDEGHTAQVVIQVQPTADSTPDAFSFAAVTGAALSAVVQSAPITVAGIGVPAAISILGGEYSINAGAFTSQPGTVVNGNTVQVRLTSSALDLTPASSTLTIGGTSATFNVTTGGLDTIAPSVPTAPTATAAGPSQINLSWTAPTDNVGVTAYRVYRGGVFQATVSGSTSFGDTGLSASTSYSYTVAACDAAGNCSGPSAATSATTNAPPGSVYTANLELGFNLIGNSLNLTINVPATFGSVDAPVTGVTDNVVTVWKWAIVDGVGRWAFHSPQLGAAANAAYAASKGYDVLTTINAGEGYWVNSITPMTLPPQTATDFNWNAITFANLPSGFNLIAHSSVRTPSDFNNDVSVVPPSPGTIPTGNFLSLWVWDAVAGKWYFYSPLLEAGGLQAVKDYADSHFYLHFQDYNKKIGLGVGFWVNRP